MKGRDRGCWQTSARKSNNLPILLILDISGSKNTGIMTTYIATRIEFQLTIQELGGWLMRYLKVRSPYLEIWNLPTQHILHLQPPKTLLLVHWSPYAPTTTEFNEQILHTSFLNCSSMQDLCLLHSIINILHL